MSQVGTPAAPAPRPLSRRGAMLGAVIAIATAILYFIAVQNYSTEGGLTAPDAPSSVSPRDILVTVEPLLLDATTNEATVRLSFEAEGSDLVVNDRLTANTRITIASSDGAQEVKFLEGDSLGRAEVSIGVAGEQAGYPFDEHVGFFTMVADTYVRGSDGGLESTGSIPLRVQATGGINGWNTELGLPDFTGQQVYVGMNFTRVFSNKAFALLILAVASVLSVLALFTSLLVVTNRRRIEVALLAWTGSLLFALPLLRTYLPNGPPVGAAIDIYLYMWLIIGAGIAATLVVIAWIQQKGAELRSQGGA